MNIDNTLYTGRPTDQRSDVEMAIYDKLDALGMLIAAILLIQKTLPTTVNNKAACTIKN